MTYSAWVFQLRDRVTRRIVGRAVVCPNARYASVRWDGASRLERAFASPGFWKPIEEQIRERLPTTPLPKDSPISVLISHDTYNVQYIVEQPVNAADPHAVVGELDALLRPMLPT